MRALTPWTGMANLKQEMDRMFDRMFEGKWDELPAVGDWAPSMDISETKDSLVAKVEVPGMDQKDIQISLRENLLTIRGEKKQEKEDKDEQYHRVERSYGAFTRSVRLPFGLYAIMYPASLNIGLLSLTMHQTRAASGTPIPIKAE